MQAGRPSSSSACERGKGELHLIFSKAMNSFLQIKNKLEEFELKIQNRIRLHGGLSQIINFADAELETAYLK